MMIYAIAFVAVIATGMIGVASHGSNRWIVLFGVRFQPSELMKPAIIILFATLLTHKGRKIDGAVPMLKVAAWALIPAGIIAYTNLSTAMIVVGIAVFMLFVAVRSYKYHLILLLGGIGAYLGAYPLSLLLQKMKVLHGYQITRILAWKDPSSYEDETFQTLQGLYAIGSGGIFGRGLGESIQKFIMPESQNDMIFTIICEEFGVFGGICRRPFWILAGHRCNGSYCLTSDFKHCSGNQLHPEYGNYPSLYQLRRYVTCDFVGGNRNLPKCFLSDYFGRIKQCRKYEDIAFFQKLKKQTVSVDVN